MREKTVHKISAARTFSQTTKVFSTHEVKLIGDWMSSQRGTVSLSLAGVYMYLSEQGVLRIFGHVIAHARQGGRRSAA